MEFLEVTINLTFLGKFSFSRAQREFSLRAALYKCSCPLDPFAMVNLPKGISLFVRFDDLYSHSGWNGANDESAAILGAQFKIGKYVKIAPNFRMAMPKADGAKSQYWAYVNCYFGI